MTSIPDSGHMVDVMTSIPDSGHMVDVMTSIPDSGQMMGGCSDTVQVLSG